MYQIHAEHYLVIYYVKFCPTKHGSLHHSAFGISLYNFLCFLFTQVLVPGLLQCFSLIISWCMLNGKIYLFI